MRYVLVIGVVLLLVGFAGLAYRNAQQSVKKEPEPSSLLQKITVDGVSVHVTVADTEAVRVRGLSGRALLAENEGMLFIFPADGEWGIWMKDMLITLDILWIAADGRVIAIKERVSPETFPTVFTPQERARYVLEVPAGFVKKNTIEIGSSMDI